MLRTRLLFAGLVVIGAACSSSGIDQTSSTATEAVTESASEPDAPPSRVAGPISDDVALAAGGLADGTLTIDGLRVDYVTIVPSEFEPGDTAPVLLAFPPGGQSIETTRSVAQQTYVREAVERGWVVFSPASPIGGDRWYQESSQLVPSLLDWIETWATPEGGSVHVAGVSNGGLSTFATAAIAPGRVQSLTTFPGFPRGAEAREALSELVDVPVRMFVGETDTGWVEPMQVAADTLDGLGGDVTLEIVEGEGHIISGLRDGVRIFDGLDAIRTS